MDIIVPLLAVTGFYSILIAIMKIAIQDKPSKINTLTDIRCPDCNKLLLKVSEDTKGTLSCWCLRCKKDIVIVRAS